VANEMNITQSAVSKKISWLENDLGFRLFDRNPRQIVLTHQGKEYLANTAKLLEELELVESRIKGELTTISGRIAISAPSAFATQRLAAPIHQFMTLHPKVTFNVSVNDKMINLLEDNTDIAIRASVLKDSGLRAKKLLDHQVCYFAANTYLDSHPAPNNAQDLVQHQCVTYSLISPSNIWKIDGEKVKVQETFTSDNPEMIVDMAKRGCGIAAMPRWMVEEEFNQGNLVEILSHLEKPSLTMYAVYKNDEHLPFRIRAFIDFLADYFQ
tara:strand:- start:1514 stop:2320 length:807 start_codon:yes stop_codon:yes gene_type:complete